MKMTAPLCSCVTQDVFVCWAPCQHTLTLLRSRAGVSGAEWVTEGLMLALSSSDTTRTYWSTKLPSWLSFEMKVEKASQPCWNWSRERDGQKETDWASRKRKNREGCWDYSREWLACINRGSLCVLSGILHRADTSNWAWRRFFVIVSPYHQLKLVCLDATKWSSGVQYG